MDERKDENECKGHDVRRVRRTRLRTARRIKKNPRQEGCQEKLIRRQQLGVRPSYLDTK